MSRWKRIQVFGFCIVLMVGIFALFAACRKESDIEEPSISAEENKNDSIDTAAITNVPEEYTVVAPDAESYYEQNSEVISVIDANTSDKVLTEAETCDILTDRGFTQFPITSSYSMDGEYYEAEEIADAGSAKHPIYETYYVTTNGDIWTIFMINGVTMANPVTYNLQSNLEVKVMISEFETVMSYDSTTNKFFETIPDASALLILTVENIDAILLETITVEEIDGQVN